MPEAGKPFEIVKESKPKEVNDRPNLEEFEWLKYQDTGDRRGKVVTALLDNPLVPIGAVATVMALVCGLYNFRKGDSTKQQFFMRARVGAQGFTIAAFIGGMFYQAHLKDQENQEKLQSRKQNKDGLENSIDNSKS